MATLAVTAVAQAVTIPAGTPVTVSAACTLGLTPAGAATGPTVTGNFTWPGLVAPGPGVAGSTVTLYVQTATTANLNYLS